MGRIGPLDTKSVGAGFLVACALVYLNLLPIPRK